MREASWRSGAKTTDTFFARGSHRYFLAFACVSALSSCSAQFQANDKSPKADLAVIDQRLKLAKDLKRQPLSDVASRSIPSSFVALTNDNLLPPYYLQAKYVCTPSGFGRTASCSPRNS